MKILLVALLAITACSRRAHQTPDQRFWSWFASHADELAKLEPERILERIQPELDKVHRGVFAETGMDGEQHLLVLTADGIREVFPVVERLDAGKPDVRGWKIVAFRQRAPASTMTAFEMNGLTFDATRIRFVADRNGDKLDVDFYVPGYVEDADRGPGQLTFVALDHMLGEYDVETRLGAITLHALDGAPAHARPFLELVGEVDKLKL